jgi:hypothetical protein
MKKFGFSLFICIFSLLLWFIPALAVDSSSEIEELKSEVKRLQQMEGHLKKEMQKLLNRIEELEKKHAETETKTVETEKKVAEVEKKAEKAEKKLLKDRVNFSGEARFRIVRSTQDTDKGFYGDNKPSEDMEAVDETYFPLRFRLNAHVEIIPDIVDVYARLTMNKNWGLSEASLTDPLDNPNSFEASKGRDITPRFEQAYTTIKIPAINTTWYIGRLPGLDGPPSRHSGSLFPRLFIDSEIDGTLVKWDAPETSLDKVELPWTNTRLWGRRSEHEEAPSLKPYQAKVKDRTGIIIGYLKYDERKESFPDDADVYLAQAQVKVGKDTAIILDGLYMDDWHMPNTSNYKGVPDLKTPYWLTGFYADTQLLGLQVYGAYYYSHFKIPTHSWVDDGNTYTYEGKGFPGNIWYLGLNTGDLITPNQQLCVEYAKGSDAWINPFNYRGFRRKGTVQSPANNYFYHSKGTNTIVGFYPFNAGVWDIYYDYYYHQKVRFRLGLMDFQFDKHDIKEGGFSILGSNKYLHQWWPYFEVNISF